MSGRAQRRGHDFAEKRTGTSLADARFMRFGLVFSATLVAFSSLSSLARAESAPAPSRCRVDVLPHGAAPANIPAFVVVDTSSPGLRVTVSVPGSSLQPAPDPWIEHVTLLAPSSALSVGKTTIAYTTTCSKDGQSVDASTPVEIVDPVALPTRIGTVAAPVVKETETVYAIDYTPEAKAFLEVTGFELFSDGVSTGKQPYGFAVRFGNAAFSLQGGVPYFGGTIIGAKALCAKPEGRELHHLELRAHVAGASKDPEPLAFDADIDCNAPVSGSYLPDGGGDDRGASGGGGCRASGGRDAGSVAILFAVGAVIGLVVKRRRAR